jgi:hypothetical protein
MAEIHRRAGDLTEARRWYAGVSEMYPQSIFALLAKQQLERLELLRIAAEAGEEQSEEPPVDRRGKFEHLRISPQTDLTLQRMRWPVYFVPVRVVEHLEVMPRVVKP